MSSNTRNGLSYSDAGKLGYEKSKDTHADLKTARVDRYVENPSKCKLCKIPLDYDHRMNKFCGHSCSASFNNMGICRNQKTVVVENTNSLTDKVRNEYEIKKEINLYCLNCDKVLVKNQKKYCSIKCDKDHKWEIKKSEIERRGHVNLNKVANTKVARKYLIDVNGCKCDTCGITKWMSQDVPLVLDHISGNSDDWSLSNLRMICGNCDMQTPTYKGKNLGNGRHYRKIRYKKGQSY